MGWLRERSDRRRWLRTNAENWRLLAGRGFSQAIHVFRLLAKGLRGPVGSRPDDVREDYQRHCAGCAVNFAGSL